MGRRPILLITFALYAIISFGLAINHHSYVGLLVLRALQNFGASAVLAVAYGVIADICVPAERGSMQGPALGAANLAVCIGPILGGWIAFRDGSCEWVFWILVIFRGIALIMVAFWLPETARNLVGNETRKCLDGKNHAKSIHMSVRTSTAHRRTIWRCQTPAQM